MSTALSGSPSHDMHDMKRPRACISSDVFRSTPTGHTTQDAGIIDGSRVPDIAERASRVAGGISIEESSEIRLFRSIECAGLDIGLVIKINNATTSSFTSCTASSGIHRNEDHYYQHDSAKRIQLEKQPSRCPVCKL
jgi:hypothetical protein